MTGFPLNDIVRFSLLVIDMVTHCDFGAFRIRFERKKLSFSSLYFTSTRVDYSVFRIHRERMN